jgi:predicted nucleic acid-binding protein
VIILDTNVLSELLRPLPDSRVAEWIDSQPEDELFTTAITVQESFYGAELLSDSNRKSALISRLERLYANILTGRVLPFDELDARYTAVLLARSRAVGLTLHQADAQIAGIALRHGATLATRNVRDFPHAQLTLCNPWTGHGAERQPD